MEDNYIIKRSVGREEMEGRSMRILKEMINILEDKFGNINRDDCYWLINKNSFYLIKDYILCEKGKEKIYGIDISFTDDLVNEPLIYEIGLVYKKPIIHHIYDNNYLNFQPKIIGFDFEHGFPEVKKVIFNDPATIVYWKDETKTVVKCQKGDDFDQEKGFAMAFLKKCWGNNGNFNDKLRKIIKEAK